MEDTELTAAGGGGADPRRVHLVGSLGLGDAETAFAAVAGALGPLCPRVPDGEPGARTNWIRWQLATFEGCGSLERAASLDQDGFRDGIERPLFAVRDGVDPAGIDLGELGYGAAAVESFAVFSRLQGEGRLAPDCRFLVAVPTPVALCCNFIVARDQLGVEPAVEAALARDLGRMQAAIPAARLSVQFDVCIEVVGADGGVPLPYDSPIEGALERLERLCGHVGDGVELGFHLCYGDPGHRHLIEPEDLGTCVAFANGIAGRLARPVGFVHMPVPRGRSDAAYFAPLRGIRLPEATRLVLGLVHHSDGVAGGRARMAAADGFVRSYDIATECGFGRRDPATIPGLLGIHRELCA